MRAGFFPALAGILAAMLLGSMAAAQIQTSPPPPPPAATLTSAQVDRLTAPIALYPDPLVAQILVAATYPLEIVEADRWLQQPGNAALKGEQLEAALALLPWDPSIKSLAAFPQILGMMDKYLTWTEELGDAVLGGQPAVMDSVQRLRQKAEAAGGLISTPEEVVSSDGGPIAIAPANPEIVYVPVYDPTVAYGEWPYPDYPPYSFSDVFPAVATGGTGWVEVIVLERHMRRHRFDWRRHRIVVDTTTFAPRDVQQPPITSGVWQHDPTHRRGVPYRDPAADARFQSASRTETRPAFHGSSAIAPTPLVQPTVGAGYPPAVLSGRPPAPPIMHVPAAAIAQPPVVLRGTPPVLQSFQRAPEMPAEVRRVRPSSVAMPSPIVAAPAVGAAGLAPRVAPTPHVAPAPRAAPALDGMPDHR